MLRFTSRFLKKTLMYLAVYLQTGRIMWIILLVWSTSTGAAAIPGHGKSMDQPIESHLDKNPMVQEHDSGVNRNDITFPAAGTTSGLSPVVSNFRIKTTDEKTDGDTLYVKEFVLAQDVVEREPVGIVQSYSMSDTRAWCFARLHNSEEMQDVYFKWFYEDQLYFEMNSKIGVSPDWRTYSSVGLQPGSWRVLLENKEGVELDEIRFHVDE